MHSSRLGFGTSGIMGSAITQGGRLRLLADAFDHGIRHIDTAPLYGRGLAEELVGRFARGRREAISITTKCGLAPGRIPVALRPLLPVARVLQRRVRRRWRSGASGIAAPLQAGGGGSPATPEPAGGTAPLPPYSESEIRTSLETSLRKLGTDYVDYFLLHECDPARLTDDVIARLEQLVQDGKIRRYGIGTGRGSSRRILETRPDFRGVVQIPDDLLEPDTGWFVAHAPAPLFTHSVLQTPLRFHADNPTLRALLEAWGERTGRDPAQQGLLSELLLLGGLLSNPEGCVVISTSRPERIAAHADVLQRFGELGPLLRQLQAGGEGDDGRVPPCS